eukprot:GEMP01049271.1.p1 GENE.GEMP01049271.1~~GEMP01049271.1.p1  ORF type:complete len:333 (+),score=69.65 GEMP01049271.1:199-1197(+)
MASEADVSLLWVHHSLDKDKYLALVSTLGMVASCTVILSPMSLMIKIMNGKVSARDAMSVLPMVVMMFVQSALWACFGYVTLHVSISHVNAFGAMMAAIYLRVLAEATSGVDRRHVEMLCWFVVIGVATFCTGMLTFVHDTVVLESVLGNLAIFFNVGLFVAPIAHLFEIVETGQVDNFPVGLTVCGFLSSMLWAQYSLMINSVPYLIPNIIGIVCNGLSVLFYTYLRLSVAASTDHARAPLMDEKAAVAGYAATKSSATHDGKPVSVGSNFVAYGLNLQWFECKGTLKTDTPSTHDPDDAEQDDLLIRVVSDDETESKIIVSGVCVDTGSS